MEKTRILIRKFSVCDDERTKELNWRFCRCSVSPNGFCEYHPQCVETIPYHEAVKIMAKAICLSDDDGGCKGKCNVKCSTWKYSIPAAEAALTDLVEATK